MYIPYIITNIIMDMTVNGNEHNVWFIQVSNPIHCVSLSDFWQLFDCKNVPYTTHYPTGCANKKQSLRKNSLSQLL